MDSLSQSVVVLHCIRGRKDVVKLRLTFQQLLILANASSIAPMTYIAWQWLVGK